MKRNVLALCACLATLAGHAAAATPKPAVPATVATKAKAPASFQDIMRDQVVPASTVLWNAVSVESNEHGIIEHKPTTEKEWRSLQRQAQRLIDAGNLLLDRSRPIATAGAAVQDADQPGLLKPDEIRQRMDADPALLARKVQAFHEAATKMLLAIKAKNPDGLTDAGSELDEACEACHKTYWYPNSAQGQ